ncbi:MAG: hypothetical protein AAB757_01630 [Patescibacteria group bacterium]
MADNQKQKVPSWAWWLLIIVSMAIAVPSMMTKGGFFQATPGQMSQEYILTSGASKKIQIPPGYNFRIYSASLTVEAVDWRGREYGKDPKWLGDDIENANFVVVNKGSEVAKVTLVLREK